MDPLIYAKLVEACTGLKQRTTVLQVLTRSAEDIRHTAEQIPDSDLQDFFSKDGVSEALEWHPGVKLLNYEVLRRKNCIEDWQINDHGLVVIKTKHPVNYMKIDMVGAE